MTARAGLSISAAAALCASAVPVHAGATKGGCAAHAAEASERSGMPQDVLLRVMAAESRGQPRVVSPKGAMGCMQIMPATWSYLTHRYRLGADPWAPRMNMIAGALYLAELAAEFGLPGAYAAYNAGPARYRKFVAGRARLPTETLAYTARLGGGAQDANSAPVPMRWQQAALFALRDAPPAAPGSRVERAPEAARRSSDDRRRASAGLFPLQQRDAGSRAN